MKKLVALLLMCILCGCDGICAWNACIKRNPHGAMLRSIEDDLNSERAIGYLNPEIRLSFGKTNIKGQNLGTFVARKRTNGTNKTPEASCQIAFLTAVKALQDKATIKGGNAVINIHSFWRKIPEWSDTEYHCEHGALMSGVALRGTIVKQ